MDWDEVLWSLADFIGLWLARLLGVLLVVAGAILALGAVAIFFVVSEMAEIPFVGKAAIAVLGLLFAASVVSAGNHIIRGLRFRT